MSRNAASAQQFLTFKLAGEEYGVGILAVQEIRGWSAVTTIPHAPEWVLGVMDLRGVTVPVIDLRRRFEFEPAQFGPSTVVIVIRVPNGEQERTLGLVVDAVSEVYDLDCVRLPQPARSRQRGRERARAGAGAKRTARPSFCWMRRGSR